MFSLMPQIFVLVISITAVGYAGFRFNFGPVPDMPSWLAVVISALALYHAHLALFTIRNAMRVSKLSDEEYLHPVPLPVEITLNNAEPQLFQLKEISVTKIILELNEKPEFKLGAEIKVGIYLPGFSLTIPAKIERIELIEDGKRRYLIRFHWQSQHDRDKLDLCLHAGRWYRPVLGYREHWRTPYDVLYDFIKTGSFRDRTRVSWQPAVYASAAKHNVSRHLCFISEKRHAEALPWLLTFDPIKPHTELEISNPGKDQQQKRSFTVGATIVGKLVDEDALVIVNGGIFSEIDVSHATKISGQNKEAEIIPLKPVISGAK